MLYNIYMGKRRIYDSNFIIRTIMTAILILVAILAWPKGNVAVNQSNRLDDSKTQVKVVNNRINIRKEASSSSEDLGDVYQNEIYDVLDYQEDDTYYWYKIKTSTDIEGYIASDKNDPYVKLISGVIDLEPPVITTDEDFLVFDEGEVVLDDIHCTDNYSSCSLAFEDNYINLIVTARDERGNTSTKNINYYKVYSASPKMEETSDNVNASYLIEKNGTERFIDVTYTLNKKVLSSDKSISYEPIVIFYNGNFVEIDSMVIKRNLKELNSNCINDYNMNLKEEYLNSDLDKSSKLCVNFTITDNLNIKYYRIGIQGVENYNNNSNYLANYYSKIYKW